MDYPMKISLGAIFQNQKQLKPSNLPDGLEIQRELCIDMKNLQRRYAFSHPIKQQFYHVALPMKRRWRVSKDNEFHLWIAKSLSIDSNSDGCKCSERSFSASRRTIPRLLRDLSAHPRPPSWIQNPRLWRSGYS